MSHRAPAVCGGSAPGNEEVGDGYVKPISFQGDSKVRADQRAYLINCTTKKCDSNLTYAHQEAMCTNLFWIEKGLPPDATDPPTPTMCPDFLLAVLQRTSKARRGWGSNSGGRAMVLRTAPVIATNEAGVELRHLKPWGRLGTSPAKCMHCTPMKHKKRCPCPDCTSERKLAADAFGRRTTH